ncbi:hypothetical protein Tco_0056858, partial [Tanacetum coccineum]
MVLTMGKKQKVLDVEDISIHESAKFVKEEEIEVKQPVLKISRRKSKARKGIGLHTSTEPESGEVDITSSKIVKWKILRHGAMLHNISRDDLVDLYKIMLQKTAYGPEEDLERAFAENLRIMFDPPQSEVQVRRGLLGIIVPDLSLVVIELSLVDIVKSASTKL